MFSTTVSAAQLTMPSDVADPSVVLVSGQLSLEPLLRCNFSSLPLFIHTEGKNGTLSILTIFDPSRNKVWLIQVKRLPKDGFHIKPTATGKSLQSILEDAHITKYLWDVRNDAKALWTQFQVKLAGAIDIQLLENASRKSNKTLLHDLEKAIQEDGKFTSQQRQRWAHGKKEINDLKLDDVFSQRLLDPKTIRYCVNNVVFLPKLKEIYLGRITHEWKGKAVAESQKRLEQACSAQSEMTETERSRGPWPQHH